MLASSIDQGSEGSRADDSSESPESSAASGVVEWEERTAANNKLSSQFF